MGVGLKKKSQGGFTGLFYIEMIIVLFFFMIAATVILNAFVAADEISNESGILERMSFCGQTAAECFALSGDVSEAVDAAFGASVGDESISVIPLNEKCEYSVDRAYEAVISAFEEENIPVMEIRFNNKKGEQIYSIRCAGRSEAFYDE
ncbi:MAG: type II secretion system protein [Oscillospiraceae bacterium]